MPGPLLAAVAWPYANGPRHIGHVAGFGIPSDIWARWARMAGHEVLMVSGTDEHGTPITVEAERQGLTPAELVRRNNEAIVDDLQALGLSYDLFTRTATTNHYAVSQELFRGLLRSGAVIEIEQLAAFSSVDGRTLPDRYIEGTCPICNYPAARGDQCDNCGNQLDPADLIEPRSTIDGKPPVFRTTTQYALDLPRFAPILRPWLDAKLSWRPNVRKFSLRLFDDAVVRAITRDTGWGVPVPVEAWEHDPLKRIYVWFDAVIGYLSASIEWAALTGDELAWQRWWLVEDAEHAYFQGKDNIPFHSFLWPVMLAAYDGPLRDRPDGSHPPLHLPDDVVASEYLTMEGKKFSSSRKVVIYVRDVVERYGPDPLRYYLAIAGPENSDTDFTWAEFVRRNNEELVANWGNLVQRVCAMLRREGATVPERADRPADGEELLDRIAAGFDTVGGSISRFRFKEALVEAMALAQEVNALLSRHEPWKLLKTDRAAALGVLGVAYDAICDLNVMLTPFLPHGAQRVYANLGVDADVPLPERSLVGEGDDRHLVLRTPLGGPTWGPLRMPPGAPLGEASPLFAKLDPSVVDDELARLADAPA
ncbi:MAG: methionyl-tRNA synthetase [Acidimicrobiales bacterium]|nr:methionyl-tRNA synthetase [Acidimicrobiales bacterium]